MKIIENSISISSDIAFSWKRNALSDGVYFSARSFPSNHKVTEYFSNVDEAMKFCDDLKAQLEKLVSQ